MGCRIRKLDKATIDAKLKAILSTARLEALAERYPGELSRRPAAARVARPRAGGRARDPAARRAALATSTPTCARRCASRSAACTTSYRYTTVYVTHDQAEAMTTADLIAVMNHGKRRAARPAGGDLRPAALGVRRPLHRRHQHPARRGARRRRVAVARRAAGDDGAAPAGGPAGGAVGAPARDRDRQREAAIGRQSCFHAVVTRQVFLGSVRDYTVALDDKTELRVTAPPGRNIAPGQAVWLHLPAEQCRALAEE